MYIRFSTSKVAKAKYDMLNLRIETISVFGLRSSSLIIKESKATGIIVDNHTDFFSVADS